jgi:hypothetical protein
MSQQEKSFYYKTLKDAGIEFSQHYREYSTEDLKRAYNSLNEQLAARGENQLPRFTPPPAEAPGSTTAPDDGPEPDPVATSPLPPEDYDPGPQQALPPTRDRDPNEMPGQRLNTHGDDEPIRVDEQGRLWYQEEVQKPAVPRPRGRRVLQYQDTGTRMETVQVGEYTESFEVAGNGPARASEIKITLPSYQVGIYRDPRFPFKIHTYAGADGFDLFEVRDYYGGAELVPPSIKHIYVSNSLCYDIRTTIQTIEAEYRHLQLQGKVD